MDRKIIIFHDRSFSLLLTLLHFLPAALTAALSSSPLLADASASLGSERSALARKRFTLQGLSNRRSLPAGNGTASWLVSIRTHPSSHPGVCLLSCLSSLCQSSPRSLEPFFICEWLLKETWDPQELWNRRIFEFSEESELCAKQVSLRRQQKNWETSSSSKHLSVVLHGAYTILPTFSKPYCHFRVGCSPDSLVPVTWIAKRPKWGVQMCLCFGILPSIHLKICLSVFVFLSVCLSSLDYLLLWLYFGRWWSRARFEGKQLETVLSNDVRLELFLPYEHHC